jgi:hypothetical protein
MAFTRDDLAAYESQPQTQVAEKPIVTAPAATEPEPLPTESAADADSSAADASDQPEAGDVTSDDNSSESSTEGADESGETAEGETEGEPEGELTEGETESTGQQPKQSRAFKRIQELNAKALEASDLAEGYKEFGKLTAEQLKAAREELAALRAQLAGDKPAPAAETPPAAPVAKLGPMPKLTDPDVNFDPDTLAQKVEEWTEKKVELSVKAALQTAGKQTEAAKTVQTFQSRIEDFKKTATDWDAKVRNPELPKLDPAAQSVLVKSELGPQMVYHLASNIAEAKRIAALAPEDQVMEIGVLKATLAAAAKPAPTSTAKTPVTSAKPVVKKSVSQAPPPPTPVPAGKRAQGREITDPGMDMDEFARRHRESKNNARLAARKMRGLN